MTSPAAQRMEAACCCCERFATGGPVPWWLRRRPGPAYLHGRHRGRSGEIARPTVSAAGFDVTRARNMSMVESPPVYVAVNLKFLSVDAALATREFQIQNRTQIADSLVLLRFRGSRMNERQRMNEPQMPARSVCDNRPESVARMTLDRRSESRSRLSMIGCGELSDG